MSLISFRPASFLATASLCLAALSSPCLAGGHGGGGGSMSGGGAQISDHPSTGAGPEHSSNGATANTTATGMPAPNAAKTAAAQPAVAKKITVQKLLQADQAVHLRHMN
jgi:hemin uptake protein HemP